jgi:hypothetical protein
MCCGCFPANAREKTVLKAINKVRYEFKLDSVFAKIQKSVMKLSAKAQMCGHNFIGTTWFMSKSKMTKSVSCGKRNRAHSDRQIWLFGKSSSEFDFKFLLIYRFYNISISARLRIKVEIFR